MERNNIDHISKLEKLSLSNEHSATICGNKDQSVNVAGGIDTQAQRRNPVERVSPPNTAAPEAMLTTKQLFQHWNAVNKKVKPIRLLFDIPETRMVKDQWSKHVVYKVVVIKSGTYDGSQSYIERRYSDFEKLHKNILRNFKEEVEEITFPKKIMSGNFQPEKITERKLAFRDYLAQLYAIKDIRFSDEFIEFFFLHEVQEGYGFLRSGQYSRALNSLMNVLSLQEKLCMHHHDRLVLTLSAIGVCCRDLNDIHGAYEFCEKAGLILHKNYCHKYYFPLINVQIMLGKELGKNMQHLQHSLIKLEELHGSQNNLPSLKELVVQEFIQ